MEKINYLGNLESKRIEIENKEKELSQYDIVCNDFLKINFEKIRKESDLDDEIYKFKEKEIEDNFVGRRENIEKFQSPEFLSSFFESKGCTIFSPLPISNRESTTLYISAGVQILDSIIHKEEEIPYQKFFVAQPVIRMQFIDKIEEGISTSFINISTEAVNKTPQDHFNDFNNWLELLSIIGFNKVDFTVKYKKSAEKWGNRKFINNVIKIYYNDLEIGDACYIEDMPQDKRENLSISDIGFGLERIKLILFPEKSYFENINFYFKNLSETKSDICILDYSRSLALLAGQGVVPSNKEHGYRFRQLSKFLVRHNLDRKKDISKILDIFYDDWVKWLEMPVSKKDAIKLIMQENERNFNRELLNELKKHYSDVDIDINQKTEEVLIALKGTSVKKDHLDQILNEIL